MSDGPTLANASLTEGLVTLERHIANAQKAHPEASGVFSQLLYDFVLGGKYISHALRRGGLSDTLGLAGDINVQGEAQKKLDVISDETLIEIHRKSGRVGVVASEENEHVIAVEGEGELPYAVVFDPLDGSSNTEVNVSLGTIFGIYRRQNPSAPGSDADVLRPGRELLAAGYINYGPHTNLVYSVGAGVHGFTLDPHCGEFLLTHPDLRFPDTFKYFSANQGGESTWQPEVKRYVEWLRGLDPDAPRKALSSRYVGTLVVDFHRNLIDGGVFLYPAVSKDGAPPKGKLRLVYELAPLAFIAEQAGGAASNGAMPILDIVPDTLHQREPVFIGNRDLVAKAEEYLAGGS